MERRVETKNNIIVLFFTSLLFFFTLALNANAQTILFDDFDSYPEGAHLSFGGYGSWIGRWGKNITVSAEEFVSEPYSAKMDNNSSCWESQLYQPIPYYPVIWFSADIMGKVSGRTGCHETDALVRLFNPSQGGIWGSTVMAIGLMSGPGENNLGPGLIAQTSVFQIGNDYGWEDVVNLEPNYQDLAGKWINVMAKVDIQENQADVWVDGVYRASLIMNPNCPLYSGIALDCGEGIGYVDNVHIFLDGPNPGDDADVLQIGVPHTELTHHGQFHFFKLESESGKDLIVTLDQQITGSGTLEFYGRSGKAPVRFRYDYHEASQNYQLHQSLYIPSSQNPTTYYFLVYDANSGSETSTFTISANYPGFSLSNIIPTKGGNSGAVTVRFRGSGFTPETTAKLICSQGQEIIPESTNFINSTDISATFDLTNKTPGTCDVVLSKPCAEDVQIPDGFTIEQGGEAKLWVEIIGRQVMRVGREHTFEIRYGNRGTIDAIGVPFWISVEPLNASVVLDLDIIPPILPEGAEPVDWSQVPLFFKTENEIVFPLMLPFIPAGTDMLFKVSITVPTSGEFVLKAWVGEPEFRSFQDLQMPYTILALKALGKSNNPWSAECGLSAINAITSCMGLIPGAKCVTAIVLAFDSILTQGVLTGVDLFNMGETRALSIIQTLVGAYSSAGNVAEECLKETLGPINDFIGGFSCGMSIGSTIFACWPRNEAGSLSGVVVTSIDPNDKAAPTGFDTEGTPEEQLKKYVAGDHSFGYAIFFENLETATAAAQEIFITDQLDSNLDWTTFSFGQMQIGEKIVSVPEGVKNFHKIVDLRPDINALVDIDCNLKLATGVFECLFRGKDPDTGELADFLPPNTEAVDPKGRGWISYSVMPKPDLPTGTVIKNKATIDFEVDIPPDPMETPEVFNTIDSGIPTSSVSPLSATRTSSIFTVSWSGSDDAGGSDIKNYDIYVSDNGGPYTLWLTTQDISANFTGVNGHQYSFYSRARDNVGNIEDAPAVPDAATIITGSQYIRLTSPNGGEVLPSGGTYGIYWEAPSNSVKFKLAYSLDNGLTWYPIPKTGDFITGTSYDWNVPKVWGNQKKCLVKVVGYNAKGVKVGADKSDAPFKIEVIRVETPTNGETLKSGDTYTITWITNGAKRDVAKTKIYYTKDGGTTWEKIAGITGNPGSYDWTVPCVKNNKTNCKVKVILLDIDGNILGEDTSSGYFTIARTCTDIEGYWNGTSKVTITCEVDGQSESHTITGSTTIFINQNECNIDWTVPETNEKRSGIIWCNNLSVSGRACMQERLPKAKFFTNQITGSGTVNGDTVNLTGWGQCSGTYMGANFKCYLKDKTVLTRSFSYLSINDGGKAVQKPKLFMNGFLRIFGTILP